MRSKYVTGIAIISLTKQYNAAQLKLCEEQSVAFVLWSYRINGGYSLCYTFTLGLSTECRQNTNVSVTHRLELTEPV